MVLSIGEKECPRTKQHFNVVEAAKKYGVKLIVYSGFLIVKIIKIKWLMLINIQKKY